MFNKIIISFLLVVFVSCGGSDKFKNPSDDRGGSTSGGPPATDGRENSAPAENAPEQDNGPNEGDETGSRDSPQDKSDDNGGFPPNIDEYGNRTDAGAGSADPCQEVPPGPACRPYVD